MALIRMPVVLLLVAVSAGCGDSLCQDYEHSRITSPDMVVDALVVTRDCGATSDTAYRIYVVRAGDTYGGNPLFNADRVDGLDISWIAPKRLMISYRQARIFNFSNFWHSKEVENFKYVVSVVEVEKSIK